MRKPFPASKKRRSTVLIAEPYELNRRILRYLLMRRFVTWEATDESELVRLLVGRGFRIGCLLIDIRLATKSATLRNAIRQMRSQGLPVIGLIPQGQSTAMAERFLKGTESIALRAPFDEGELITLVDRCLTPVSRTHSPA